MTAYYIETLRQKLEQSIAPQKVTIRSTEFLSGLIFESIQENISSTTLQRFFGIVSNKSQISERSLDTISKFLGYKNWNSFCSDEEINSLKDNNQEVTDNMGLMLFQMALKNHNYKTIIDYIKLLIKNNDKNTLLEVDEMIKVFSEHDNSAKKILIPKINKIKSVVNTK